MASKVLFSYGSIDLYKALSVKDENTLYFITDSHEIYKGSELIADKTELNVKFVSAIPSTATSVENVLYIATVEGKTTSWVKSGSTMIQVGGGEATEIADGVLKITNFAEGTIAKTLDAATDEQIPTAKAVSDAITTAVGQLDSAFVDVVTEAAPEGTAGTVLKFTTKGGETKSVTIADIFLAGATYDSAKHILTLTLNDAQHSKVEVDLSTLVGSSLSDVSVGEDEAFTVELGAGATLGGFKTGDKISKDMTVENIVKKLLMKQVPPTYVQPSVAISNNAGSSAGNYEIGSTLNVKLRATFTQHDAGELTNIQFKKNSVNVGEASTSTPADYAEESLSLVSATTYSATATYAEGDVKNDNLGQAYPTGHIEAGSRDTSNYVFTPYRMGYFAGYTSDVAELTSAAIRNLQTKSNAAYRAGSFKITVKAGAKRVVIAAPATNAGVTKILNESALNADVTSTFAKSTIDVEGANGHAAITYNVWTYVPLNAYSQDAVLSVTLG